MALLLDIACRMGILKSANLGVNRLNCEVEPNETEKENNKTNRLTNFLKDEKQNTHWRP
jgi:hypothetical protein